MKVKLLLLLLSILAIGSIADTEEKKKVRDFTLRDINGKNYTLSENIGRGPIIINFWATWCLPCYGEMKELKRLYNSYAHTNLQILSISIDDVKTLSKVKVTVRANKYPFTVLLDSNQSVYKKYQLSGVPQIFLIDKNGFILYSHKGYKKGDEKKLEEKLQAITTNE
jgi:peroxiredoxin